MFLLSLSPPRGLWTCFLFCLESSRLRFCMTAAAWHLGLRSEVREPMGLRWSWWGQCYSKIRLGGEISVKRGEGQSYWSSDPQGRGNGKERSGKGSGLVGLWAAEPSAAGGAWLGACLVLGGPGAVVLWVVDLSAQESCRSQENRGTSSQTSWDQGHYYRSGKWLFRKEHKDLEADKDGFGSWLAKLVRLAENISFHGMNFRQIHFEGIMN